jgi:hypothetical protein
VIDLIGNLKMYLFAAAAGIAALGIYTLRVVAMTKQREAAKDKARRLAAIKEAREVHEEVEDSSDAELLDGITRRR